MAVQVSDAVKNARLDAVEATIVGTAHLKIFSGAQPANCAAADPSGLLADITLPADWMAAANAGSKAKSGTWEDLSADATGTAASFRIYDGSAVCHMQGSCGQGTGDLQFDNASFVQNQKVSVTQFTWNEPV